MTADQKISELTELAVAPATNDVLPIVDTDAAATKKIAVSNLFTSPTFVTPALGTPASGTLTNCGGTAASLTAGLATDTVTKTGTGSTYATNTSPTFVTPALGTPASGTLTSCTGLPEAGLTLADNTTANSSTTAHGFLKKLDNTATNFMNGAGNWAVPAGGDIVISSANAVSYATGATVVLGTSISGYRHLKLIYNFEGTDASTGTTTVIRFNGDAGANYAWLSASPTKANVTGQTGITISNALSTAILAGGQMLVNVVDSGAANIHTFTGANYTSGNVGITHWSEGGSYTANGDIAAISLVITGTGNTEGNWVLYGVN